MSAVTWKANAPNSSVAHCGHGGRPVIISITTQPTLQMSHDRVNLPVRTYCHAAHTYINESVTSDVNKKNY